MSTASTLRTRLLLPLHLWWSRWWRRQTPYRQDRFATFMPLFAVLLFLAAIAAAIVYFRLEEQDREHEIIVRDIDHAELLIRQRLLDRKEQVQAMAHGLLNRRPDAKEFAAQSDALMNQYPEVVALTWVDANEVVTAVRSLPIAPDSADRDTGASISSASLRYAYGLARNSLLPVFTQTPASAGHPELLLTVPVARRTHFEGTLTAEFSYDELLRQSVPPQTLARYAIALLDSDKLVLAGSLQSNLRSFLRSLPWAIKPPVYRVNVAPVGPSLVLQAQGYRTSQDTTGRVLFWILGALSFLSVWMLLLNWRHSRRRIQAQKALLSETNFRRAMENSMLTGMRALDMEGRITYVNPAFCSMTGWTEADLINLTPPFPYWPEKDQDALWARLDDELQGRNTPGGYEVTVRRKDGSTFDARMYVSPLIAPGGKQTGWMTSMTDITEPKRIREELTASYERFTTVLDSLDTAISVAPLGSTELLFANKMYRTWFGLRGDGHRRLIDMACSAPTTTPDSNNQDPVDDLAGLPTNPLIDASSENTEIFVPTLDKWLEVRTRYLTWVDGRLAQMVIATDITSRRLAEEQAALQAERAQTASRLITMGEMASSVAHELNQPLTAINNYCSGMISRLQKQQISEEDLLSALEKTARQAQRAGQIIQRIRAFVKRSEPNPTPSDVAQMVSNATELAEIELRRHQIRLNPYLAARLPALTVDPILIEQVLINLIKNAGESIQQAGRPPAQRHVELRVAPRQVEGLQVVEFCVQDTGTGVPPEMIERIYEAFYSTKTEGMGIGLKLCRSIVEAHHGRLKARNLYNGDEIAGCEFSFWIPVTLPGVAGNSDLSASPGSTGSVKKD